MINEERYIRNTSIRKAGVTCECPTCGKVFIKGNWQQVFCEEHCRDEYWNAKGDRHRKGYYKDYFKSCAQSSL